MGESSDSGKDRKAGNYPTVESWNDADCKLEVTQPEGWMCRVCKVLSVLLIPDIGPLRALNLPLGILKGEHGGVAQAFNGQGNYCSTWNAKD